MKTKLNQRHSPLEARPPTVFNPLTDHTGRVAESGRTGAKGSWKPTNFFRSDGILKLPNSTRDVQEQSGGVTVHLSEILFAFHDENILRTLLRGLTDIAEHSYLTRVGSRKDTLLVPPAPAAG
jgi:hypothetical protein